MTEVDQFAPSDRPAVDALATARVNRRRQIAGGPAYRALEKRVRTRIRTVVAGASIARVASNLELNHESVRRALRSGTVSLELIVRLCVKYGVSSDWLLFGAGEPDAPARPPSDTEGESLCSALFARSSP